MDVTIHYHATEAKIVSLTKLNIEILLHGSNLGLILLTKNDLSFIFLTLLSCSSINCSNCEAFTLCFSVINVFVYMYIQYEDMYEDSHYDSVFLVPCTTTEERSDSETECV